ncbi:cob(I)yrinic acid a,c-diamide adenosyltransferase, partial [Desulfovibrio sp. OttesenSCG-928-G11]|nr:cob(I)yrinic acid a,c-diamide adenosyltransferase [Desulfovibrio sp. OttesenSCG-928-G11]
KRPGQAGEQQALAALLGKDFFAGGRGFFRHEEQRAEHRRAALEVLAWAGQALARVELLVLDEALYALGSGLLLEGEVKDIIAEARMQGAHLVLSGRGLPDWLREEADIITQMLPLKHAYEEGVQALKGIEY